MLKSIKAFFARLQPFFKALMAFFTTYKASFVWLPVFFARLQPFFAVPEPSKETFMARKAMYKPNKQRLTLSFVSIWPFAKPLRQCKRYLESEPHLDTPILYTARAL